jgi:phosphoglycolate phosphatase-like HAD superfamily hydrolase
MQMIQQPGTNIYAPINQCEQNGLCSSPSSFKPYDRFSYRKQTKEVTAVSGLLLLDLDNTLTDTRRWFADSILSLTAELAAEFLVDEQTINSLFAEVATATTLHEYAFVVEVIASRLRAHRKISFRQIKSIANTFWTSFLEMHDKIELYPGILETMREIRRKHPRLQTVILTDSPEWIALERLSKVGVLPLIDGIVAIRTNTPRLRHRGYQDCVGGTMQRIAQSQYAIDTRHLKFSLSVPSSFAKPNSGGIELAAKRLGIGSVPIVILGDKDSKEGQAAANWHMRQRHRPGKGSEIYYVRAEYGNHDIDHPRYGELSGQISSLKVSPQNQNPDVKPHKAIHKFEEMEPLLNDIIGAQTQSRSFI